ncbi:feather keratin Cos2-3 [Egretta garzetta]|nr:feather keratin Cos2-3 [Egretta garzetta]
MSCYNQCRPCQPCGPTPLANSCNEPCVRQCQNSTVVIEPPAVVVTLPGPILSSFPQNTVVGSSTSAAVGSILSCDGVPITSGCCDLSGISRRYWGKRYLKGQKTPRCKWLICIRFRPYCLACCYFAKISIV